MASPGTTISVVIPVHNGERYLAEAIESVLDQASRHALEIVVVDDGSTDGSARIAASFGPPVQVVSQPNSGPSAARNAGIVRCSGEIVGFLDSDDLWPPDKLETQMRWLAPDSGYDAVVGMTRYFREAAGDDGVARRQFGMTMFVVQLGCGLFRRRLFSSVGCFDAALRYGQDVDFFLRLREQHVPVKGLTEATIFYRRHDANMTSIPDEGIVSLAGHLKRSLDRRRRGASGTDALSQWFDRRDP